MKLYFTVTTSLGYDLTVGYVSTNPEYIKEEVPKENIYVAEAPVINFEYTLDIIDDPKSFYHGAFYTGRVKVNNIVYESPDDAPNVSPLLEEVVVMEDGVIIETTYE